MSRRITTGSPALGKGMRVFTARVPLTLVASTGYPSGIVVNSYASKPADK